MTYTENLVFVAMVVAGAILYIRRARRLSQSRVSDMRLRIASRLHDDIGANLSTIALKSDMLRVAESDLPGRKAICDDISRTARDTAVALREAVWVVNSGYDSLPKLISKLEDLADGMLAGNVTYTLNRPDSVPDKALAAELRQNVYFIYKELLHNSLKHANARNITIKLTASSKRLSFRIADDGVGFDTTSTIKSNAIGFGLSSVVRRAESIKAYLKIDTSESRGTDVAFWVSLG